MPILKTKKEFIRDARRIYGYKYDYSKSVYLGNKIPVIIICKKNTDILNFYKHQMLMLVKNQMVVQNVLGVTDIIPKK